MLCYAPGHPCPPLPVGSLVLQGPPHMPPLTPPCGLVQPTSVTEHFCEAHRTEVEQPFPEEFTILGRGVSQLPIAMHCAQSTLGTQVPDSAEGTVNLQALLRWGFEG